MGLGVEEERGGKEMNKTEMQRTEKNQIGPKQKTGGLGRHIEGSTSKVQGCGLQHRQENRITFLWYLS